MEEEDNSIHFKKRNKDLLTILSKCIENKIPFYIYRKSKDNTFFCGMQISSPKCIIKDSELLVNSGFVIAPFNTNNMPYSEDDFSLEYAPLLLIKDEKSFTSKDINSFDYKFLDKINFSKTKLSHIKNNSPKETIKTTYEKDEYTKMIQDVVNEIRSSDLYKIVLSKSVLIPKNGKNDIEVFISLLNSYPNEFVFWAYIPNITSWMGASPETLLPKQGNIFKTMALAGTQKFNPQKEYDDNLIKVWNKKEIVEQNIVSQYIKSILNKSTKNLVVESIPHSKRAGNLMHICTNFHFKDKLSNKYIYKLLQDLHPTPAVCGFPKEKAKEYILKTEKHSRLYYSGFLGPIYNDASFDFFVNLRSMQIFDSYFLLFVGGGITRDSIPENEWNETEAKLQTLMEIISQ